MSTTSLSHISFREFLSRVRHSPVPRKVLAVDPGETTGYAVFLNGELKTAGQLPGTHKNLHRLITFYKPNAVVIENYQIYAWKTNQHTWSDVPTLRLIGGIELTCQQRNIPLFKQTAQQAKGFAKDSKLRQWGYYPKSRHARDAVRHGVYFLLFSKEAGDNG